MSDTITTPNTRRGTAAAARASERRPLARRRRRRPRPLLRRQPARLPDRVRRAGVRRRHGPAPLPRRVARDAERGPRGVDRSRRAAAAPRPSLAPARRRPAVVLRASSRSPRRASGRAAETCGSPRRSPVRHSSGGTSPGVAGPRHRRRRRPAAAAAAATPRPAPTPKKPSLLAPVAGALLAAAGVLGLLDVLDVYEVDLRIVFAIGVAVVGAAIAAGALTGRRVGGLVVLGLLLLACFGVAASTPVSLGAGIGDRVERGFDAASIDRTYELGLGDLTVDLGQAQLPEGRTQVDAHLGVGQLTVLVPRRGRSRPRCARRRRRSSRLRLPGRRRGRRPRPFLPWPDG